MRNYLHIALICLIAVPFSLLGQETELFFDIPQALGEEVNTDYEEAAVMVSPDGQHMYFVRTYFEENVGGDGAGHDIWMSTKTGDGWSTATNELGPLNTKWDDATIGLSSDGKRIYLLNNYQKEKKRKTGLAVADIKEKGYSKPKYIEIPSAEYDGSFYGFYMNPEETILIISTEGYESEGEEDLYVSLKQDGEWTIPIWMGETINSEGYEIAPFLSADGKRLYFASNGFGGWGGADIYECTRLDDSWTNWTKPRNLGRNINSRGFDAYINVLPDGTVYFTSKRNGSDANIYKSRILGDDEYYIDESGIVHYTQREQQDKQQAAQAAQQKVDEKFQADLAKQKAEKEAAEKAKREEEEKAKKAAEERAKKQQKEAEKKQEEIVEKQQETPPANTTLEGAPAERQKEKVVEKTTEPEPTNQNRTKGQTLNFAPNGPYLTPESGIQMDNAAFFMMDTEELVLRIYVETDSKTEKLNKERVEEVIYYMQSKGISKDRIVVDGPHKAPATSIEIFFEF